MTASPTVAWLDIRTREGWCPRHVTGAESKVPERMGLVPIGVEGARGKGCAHPECGEPLCAVVGSSAWEALYAEERL
jgi:hypothetical protein